MARAMNQVERDRFIDKLWLMNDQESRETLQLLGVEPPPEEALTDAQKAGAVVLDDVSHDMHILKACGFLFYPEVLF